MYLKTSACIVLAALGLTLFPGEVRAEERRGFWVAPEAHVAPVGMGAMGDDGHYRTPDGLVLAGGALEGGYAFSSSLMAGAGAEYNLVFDASPGSDDGRPAFTGVAVPIRLRFLGLGGDGGRFYMLGGIGYAMLWDRTRQTDATPDGGTLRSTGLLYELGMCFRIPLDDRVTLEVGVRGRLQGTTASNGVGYFESATFLQSSLPFYVSFPLAL